MFSTEYNWYDQDCSYWLYGWGVALQIYEYWNLAWRPNFQLNLELPTVGYEGSRLSYICVLLIGTEAQIVVVVKVYYAQL